MLYFFNINILYLYIQNQRGKLVYESLENFWLNSLRINHRKYLEYKRMQISINLWKVQNSGSQFFVLVVTG